MLLRNGNRNISKVIILILNNIEAEIEGGKITVKNE